MSSHHAIHHGRGSNANAIHFYQQIQVQELQDEELKIRRSFVERYWKGGVSNPISLKLPNGCEWKMFWEKRGDDIWLQKKYWKIFARSLRSGDQLVFKYKGESHFDLIIFDDSALEIDYSNIRSCNNADDEKDNRQQHYSKVEEEESDNGVVDVLNVLHRQPSKPVIKEEHKSFSNPHFQTQIGKRKINMDSDAIHPNVSGVTNGNRGGTVKRAKEGSRTETVKEGASNSHPDNPSFQLILPQSYIQEYKMRIPNKFSKEHLNELEGNVTIKRVGEDQRKWEVKLTFDAGNGHSVLSTGLKSFSQDNNLKAGDLFKFEITQPKPFSFRINIIGVRDLPSSEQSQERFPVEVMEFLGNLNSSKIQEGIDGISRNCTKTNDSGSPNMKLNTFQITVESSKKVCIPTEFLKRHKIRNGNSVELKVRGKSWMVEVSYNHDSWRFSKGWKEFVKGCNLKVGDTCLFEMIDDENLVIKVSVDAALDAAPDAPSTSSACSTFPFPGGPEDGSVLPTYGSHFAKSLWDGTDRKELRIISHGNSMLDEPHPNILNFVTASGLYPLLCLRCPNVLSGLYNAFIERWQPDTSSFHLPIGEMTVTLDDVYSLLHIPIYGIFFNVPDYTKAQGEQLLIDFLGANPTDAWAQTQAKGLYVSTTWLRDVVYPRAIEEERWEDAARAYLLYLLGTTIFTDKTGNKVKLGYLGMLRYLDQTGNYTWGGMALAYLYDQLREATKVKNRQVAGYTTLLQAWIFEHFQGDNFGIKHVDPDYVEIQPRAKRWEATKDPGRKAVRLALDRLHPDEVTWDPYTDHRVVRPFELLTLFRGHVRHAGCMMPYLPDRVVRQFGFVQGIPEDPKLRTRQTVTLEDADGMWASFDQHMIERGPTISQDHPATVSGYFAWFWRVSHPFISSSSYEVLENELVTREVLPEMIDLVDEMERAMEMTVTRGMLPRTILDRMKSLVGPFRRLRRRFWKS